MFGGINFGNLVRNYLFRQIKISTKVSGYAVYCTQHGNDEVLICTHCMFHFVVMQVALFVYLML